MSEQRVISSSKRPVGGIREVRGVAAAPAEVPKRKPKKLVVILAAVAVLAIAGAVYFFLLAPDGDAGPATEPAPVAGAVVAIDAVSINLADGHYLRLGLGLQLTADVAEPPDTSKALDRAIALFSGHTVAEVADPATRDALKAQLVTELSHAYEGEVMDVYLTDYVTQ